MQCIKHSYNLQTRKGTSIITEARLARKAMFAYLKGKVDTVLYSGVIYLDVGGVGYMVNVTTNTIVQVENRFDEIKLYTHVNVREDEIAIFGFYTMDEKELFLDLISISGIGCKMALGILSATTPDAFKQAVLFGDVKQLAKFKGLGKKTAERIVLELKDKLSPVGIVSAPDTAPTVDLPQDVFNDAITVLTGLGFNKTEASVAVTKAALVTKNLDKLIEISLKNIRNN